MSCSTMPYQTPFAVAYQLCTPHLGLQSTTNLTVRTLQATCTGEFSCMYMNSIKISIVLAWTKINSQVGVIIAISVIIVSGCESIIIT